MVVTVIFLKNLKAFFKKYPENEFLEINDEFRSSVELICDGLLNLKIVYSNYYYESEMIKILSYLTKIAMLFHKADVLEPLNNINYLLFVKLSQFIINFKILIVTDIIDEEFKSTLFLKYTSNYFLEHYICDTYKSKLEVFKTNHIENEIEAIKKSFTCFLLEFVKLVSNTYNFLLLDRNIQLLLEVADLEILIENIHYITNYISEDRKKAILKRITTYCIKTNFNLHNCELIKTSQRHFMLEKCTISYFILQQICKYLEFQDMYQSSQILSMFTIDNVISPNLEIQQFYEESIKLFTFKPYKKNKVIHPQKFQKCLKYLQLLLDSLSNDYELKSSQFDIVLLSILSELVMATDTDKSLIIFLMDFIIGHLDICKLPSNFIAVSYAFKIYQKLKFDNDMKIKSIYLCNSLSMNLGLRKGNQFMKKDLEKIINNEENWIDISIVVPYFLYNNFTAAHLNNDETLNNIICKFNEHVILASQYSPKNGLLVFPFSVSLHFSLINKNEDCLYNNLAILDDYLTILFDTNEMMRLEDKIYFFTIILRNYNHISKLLPDMFLLKCWKYVLFVPNMNIDIIKKILHFCSSENLIHIIEMLKIQTMETIKTNKVLKNEDYLYIIQLWSSLINAQFTNKKKKNRQDHVNHFCFNLNRYFLFIKKINTVRGLILLLKLFGLFLKVSWINKSTLINCSLRMITFIEKSPIEDNLMIEGTELLIVLYKCPNNCLKPNLGLYLTTFTNLLRKCWSFVRESYRSSKELHENTLIPFHKLEKCSSLFKSNKSDFDIICRYIIEDLIKLITSGGYLPEEYMRHFNNILYNLMDVCSHEDMQYILRNIDGTSVQILKGMYGEYREIIRFTGRL